VANGRQQPTSSKWLAMAVLVCAATSFDSIAGAQAPVAKLPLASTSPKQVGQGDLTFGQAGRFRPDERILPHTAAPWPDADISIEEHARQALQRLNAAGSIYVRDVSSGRVLVHVSSDGHRVQDLDQDNGSSVLPLSLIKVYIAADWLEHGFGNAVVYCAPSGDHASRRMLVEEVLSSGCDTAGAEMAKVLRHKLGSARVLRDLRHYGLHDLTLTPECDRLALG
jgi:hypothetical protein